MKKIFKPAFFIFLLFSQNISAQSWTIQTSGTDSMLWDAFFLNSTTGFACGNYGTILKTTNGGGLWSKISSGTTAQLAVIKFTDNNNGYISGANNGKTLLKTTNGGGTWTDISFSGSGNGGGIWFFSKDTGFFANGNFMGNSVISKTTNGGATWSTVYSGLTGWISYLFFCDRKNGYATSPNGTILKTTDGGNTWNANNVGANLWMSGVYFFNKDTGFVGGGMGTGVGNIFKTTNGGASWTAVNSGNAVSKITFVSRKTGYAISANTSGSGVLLKTTDGGSNWIAETTPKNNLTGLAFVNPNLGFAVGEKGVILKYSAPSSINNQGLQTGYQLTLYPNPFNHNSILKIEGNLLLENPVLKIKNILGVETELLYSVDHNEIILDRNNLPAGLYFYELTDNDRRIGNGKFMIK